MHFAAAALLSFVVKCSFQLSAFSYQLDREVPKGWYNRGWLKADS